MVNSNSRSCLVANFRAQPNSTAPFFFVTSVWPQIGDLAIPVEVYPGRLSEMPIARILATQTVITEE